MRFMENAGLSLVLALFVAFIGAGCESATAPAESEVTFQQTESIVEDVVPEIPAKVRPETEEKGIARF